MPPSPRLNDQELLDRIVEVFRRDGYEGASLARLSEATGLQRASLYHRFPGGKDSMAQAAVERVAERFQPLIIEPLRSDGSPAERVGAMVANLRRFYDSGSKNCLLGALAISVGDDTLRMAMQDSLSAWQKSLERVARDAGLSTTEARRRAEDALIRIEGALIIARIRGSTRPFTRTLESLAELLTTV